MSQGLLAIDIGGTKLAAGIVTMEGSVVSRARQPTPPNGDAEAIYAALLASVSAAIADDGAGYQIRGIGIGSGGPMRAREGLVSPLNTPGWRDFPLVARLRDDLGITAVLDNDAKAFALGEYRYGAGQGHPDMMGVVVSTGVGGGIINAGTLLHGRTLNGGHVGHLVAEPNGPRCACGGRGCVEAIASGPSIVRLVRAELERGRESALQEVPPATITAQDVARAAREGDELSVQGFERAGRALGIGFAGAAALLDFDLIVVGGGVSNTGELLMAPLRRTLAEHAALDYIRGQVRVVPSANAQDAGLIGAAALALAGREG